MYSAGKIPGGFFRREEDKLKAILACRLIDSTLRPSLMMVLDAKHKLLQQY